MQLPFPLDQTRVSDSAVSRLLWGMLGKVWTQLLGVLERLTKEGKSTMNVIPSLCFRDS